MADTIDFATLETPAPFTVATIRQHNADLSERLAHLGITAEYDPDPDILFLTLGAPQPAITESLDNWIGLRLEPATWKLVGIDLLNLKAARPDEIGAVMRLLAEAVTLGECRHSGSTPMPAAQQVASAIWELSALGEAGSANGTPD
jgi:hypothetical protein